MSKDDTTWWICKIFLLGPWSLGVRGHFLDLGESCRPSAVLGCLFVTTYHCGGQCHHHTAKAWRNASRFLLGFGWIWGCFWGNFHDDSGWFWFQTCWNMRSFRNFKFKHPPKKILYHVGGFWMLAFPICPFLFAQKSVILTWRKIHWASLPKKQHIMNQPFQLTLMFPFSMLSFTFPIDLYFLQIFVCWNLQLRWHRS